jgi:phosphoglycolate phosphatase-like HAD superfamily hydrolase
VLSGGAGGRAMSRAFEELYGVRDAFNGVPFNGRTDAWIVSQTAARHGIDTGALGEFKPRYLSHLARMLHEPGPRKGVMPGVRPLLDALSQRDDVFLALLTGNYAEGARLKLEYFDLWHYFSCGAFGDVVHERNHLLADALAQVRACSGLPAEAEHCVVIGDTPLDVGVAKFGGAKSIAVATGGHTVDDLRVAGADLVLEDLSDLEKVLAAV